MFNHFSEFFPLLFGLSLKYYYHYFGYCFFIIIITIIINDIVGNGQSHWLLSL